MNVDYLEPTIYYHNDYRTSSSRAHRFKLSTDRNFIPSNAHTLCRELKNTQFDYRPRSETTKEFQWKINPSRNFCEELAAPSGRIQYLHQFTDKIKSDKLVKPLNLYKSRAGDLIAFPNLPREIKQRLHVEPPPIEHVWRETFPDNTTGYYPYLDHSISTTQFDFHKHKDYVTAKTNLIVQKELPFNAKSAYFIPRTKLIMGNPFCKKYDAKILRDDCKFPTKSYNRITLMRTKCRDIKSEMSSNY